MSPARVSGVIGVVDDDASIRRAVARLLRTAGFIVKTFGSGEELLRCDDVATIDCLLLDVHLGGLTGFDVQDRLVARALSPPIVFITAHDDLATSERACRDGRSQYLRKPFHDDALMGAIHTALARDGAHGDGQGPRTP